MEVIPPDRGGGEQQGGAGLSPALGSRAAGTATNHPQKGDDTPGRFEKAEPGRVSRFWDIFAGRQGGGSHGTGHSGVVGVTQ